MIPDGLLWNQADLEQGDPLNDSLLMLIVIRHDLSLQLIGTAFIIQADGARAIVISAAHCFDEVRKVLHPETLHHSSALPEFLPPPKEIDLRQVKALYVKDRVPYPCIVELSLWDSKTDLAVLTVLAPDGHADLFRSMLWIDNSIPSVGEVVAMFGYGNMEIIPHKIERNAATIKRELILRIGRVENIYSERSFMLAGPSIETTIPIYGGMSGGVVARFSPGQPIKPFAFISHAPDPQPINDRSLSGHSVGAILQSHIEPMGDQVQRVAWPMDNIGVGRSERRR